MPRRKLSPKSKRAATNARQARWRRGVAQKQNQSQQAGQFIPTPTPVVSQPESSQAARRQPEVAVAPLEAQPADDYHQADNQSLLAFSDLSGHSQSACHSSHGQPSAPASRRSSRRSSSLAQSRINDYYHVSKSRSRSSINSVASRLSRTISVVIESTHRTPVAELEEDEEDDDDDDNEYGDIDSTPVNEQEELEEEDDDDSAANEQLLQEHQAVDLAAQLGQHLIKFHGCAPNTHSQARIQHLQDPRRLTNHYSFSDLEPITGQVPDVLNQPKLLKHNSPERTKDVDWGRVFEGKHAAVDEGEEEEEEERIHVCLHRSEQAHRSMNIKYDSDSTLGYATNLAFAKRGLMVNLSPRFHTNIQTGLHLFMHVTHDSGRGPRQVRVKLHQVPHYCLGYIAGQDDTRVYIFFPQQWHPDKQTNFPGKKDNIKHEILRVWTDDILLPTIAQHVDSDVGQHMPSSWRQARLNSEARFREAYAQDKDTKLFQTLHYPLQAAELKRIWDNIQHRLEEPEYAIYRGAQIFFSCKNTKSMYKSPTLAKMWQKYNEYLDYTFDFRYLDTDRVWFDLGKETVARDWCLPHEDLIMNQSPATYLMRSCCLESFYTWSHFGEPASRAKRTLFVPAMLSGSSDMLVEMSANSTKRAEGWIFYQMYNSYKEMTDVAKTKPFRSRLLSQMAWDSKLRALIEQAGGRKITTAAKVQENYQGSKNRLANTLAEGQKKSYGVREEHRVSLAFFHRIIASLTASGSWETAPLQAAAQYSFWEFSSDSFTTFLQYNVNKFLYLVERILALTSDSSVSYEHCKVVSMLLEAAKYCYDTSPLSREAGLWKDRYQVHNAGPFFQGMGLEQTIKDSGYGWFLPKINWEQLTFLPELSREIRYHDTALYDTYRKRWAAVRDVKDDFKRLEQSSGWLSMYHTNMQLLDIVFEFICTIVLQRYRKDVFHAIKDIIKPEHRENALNGKVMLCLSELEDVLLPDEKCHDSWVEVVSANRTKIRTLRQLVDYVWDFDDGQPRRQWADRPYRQLYQRALEIIQIHCGAYATERAQEKIKRVFVLTNWMIPYSSSGKFIRRNDQNQRLWVSIYSHIWRLQSENVPFPELCCYMNDKVRSKDHVRYNSKLEPIDLCEKPEFMGGRWDLSDDVNFGLMYMVPCESELFGHHIDIDIVALGEQLERQWQAAEDAGEG